MRESRARERYLASACRTFTSRAEVLPPVAARPDAKLMLRENHCGLFGRLGHHDELHPVQPSTMALTLDGHTHPATNMM